MATQRVFKAGLYALYARIGKSLSSPHRLEILELLAQGERTVESLADEIGLSPANASQHLQALKQASLVQSRRQGLFIHYSLADPAVFELSRAIRLVAERRLSDLERLVRQEFGDRRDAEAVSFDDLLTRLRRGDVIVLDTRPANEYAAGHIAGAISVPIDELKRRLRRLPKQKEYVAYCRGPYCVYADRAVALLRKTGRRARRLRGGLPEWKAAGLPTRTVLQAQAHDRDKPRRAVRLALKG
jgi:rhodanese-related sulfurtransferase/DNA-binding transcriptional ArsR family regulator